MPAVIGVAVDIASDGSQGEGQSQARSLFWETNEGTEPGTYTLSLHTNDDSTNIEVLEPKTPESMPTHYLSVRSCERCSTDPRT